MSYRYLDDVAISDIAFEAEGLSLAEVFRAAADALAGAMVEDPGAIGGDERAEIRLSAPDAEMLLFDFLSELVYLKDVRGLLLRVLDVEIKRGGDGLVLSARAAGTPVEKLRELRADVKAVTMHRFSLKKNEDGRWTARVVLDV